MNGDSGVRTHLRELRDTVPGMTSAPDRWWDCPLDVETFAAESVGRARDATARLARARGLDVHVDTSAPLVAAGFAAYDHLRVDEKGVETWAELSGFVQTADGWVRLHGNFPHHAAALRELYGIRDRAGLESVLARRRAAGIEDEVAAAGGIAVRVRERDEWARHPQALARAGHGWVECEERGARPALPPLEIAGEGDALPLDGVRVLDFTRVLAGPTATQLLACLGADVLRVDPPHRPEILAQHLATGMGKRSTLLDMQRAEDRARALALASSADVILTGYRPGALARHGMGADDLARIAPQVVLAELSAWGGTGPSGGRAGFDSIVQAATGIAVQCGSDGRPGALPVQALDLATGHRLAAEVMDALAQARARTLRLSLLGAAEELWALPPPEPEPGVPSETLSNAAPAPGSSARPSALEVPRVKVRAGEQMLDVVPPTLRLDGRDIARDVGAYGAAAPAWCA